jgi:hypothetical protein
VSDTRDTVLFPILEFDANTTCILDSHIYREKIVDLKYPTLHSIKGKLRPDGKINKRIKNDER